MNRLVHFFLSLTIGLPAIAMAQSVPSDLESWSPPALGAYPETNPEAYPGNGAEPAEVSNEGQRDGWLVNSPLMRVSWPEIPMPTVQFPPLFRDTEGGDPGLLMRPIVRAQAATRAAATRTRDAWNGTVERMKLRLPDGSQSASTTTNQPRQGLWSSWFGAEPSTGRSGEPSSVPELMAREPGENFR